MSVYWRRGNAIQPSVSEPQGEKQSAGLFLEYVLLHPMTAQKSFLWPAWLVILPFNDYNTRFSRMFRCPFTHIHKQEVFSTHTQLTAGWKSSLLMQQQACCSNTVGLWCSFLHQWNTLRADSGRWSLRKSTALFRLWNLKRLHLYVQRKKHRHTDLYRFKHLISLSGVWNYDQPHYEEALHDIVLWSAELHKMSSVGQSLWGRTQESKPPVRLHVASTHANKEEQGSFGVFKCTL